MVTVRLADTVYLFNKYRCKYSYFPQTTQHISRNNSVIRTKNAIYLAHINFYP